MKCLVLNGATADKIRAAVETAPGYADGAPAITLFKTFEEAVKAAHALAQEGDVVLMSPACASFDQFKNFALRGEAFKQIVENLE